MNDHINFTEDERNALARLTNDLRSDDGFVLNDDYDGDAWELMSAIREVLTHDDTLKDETISLLSTVKDAVIRYDKTPLANCWPLLNQRVAANDIQKKLLH